MDFAHRPGSSRRNPTGIAVIVGLHIAVAALALHGSKVLIHRGEPPVIDLLPPDLTPPPPPPPQQTVPMPDLLPPPTTIAVPDLPPDVTPPPVQPEISTRRVDDAPPPARTGSGPARTDAPPAEHVPVRVAPVVDSKACKRPEYPARALRNGEAGTVTLALLIGTDGRVAESKVERSSGSRDLDRAAQAGLALCRFQPGTVDGVPYQSWTQMQYVWNLDE